MTHTDDKFMQEVAAIKKEREQARFQAEMEREHNLFLQHYYEDKMKQISGVHDAVLRKLLFNATY